MKTHLFTIRLLLLAPILFSASCAAPTPLPTASQTHPAAQTREATPTAMQTAAPTEIPLPEGPISELQETLGDKYKLKAEGDYFVINGVDNLKFNQDGTSELAYGREDLTVAFQAISLDGEKLNVGPWQYNKEGKVTMLTAGAPKTVEDAANFPRLAYLEGHAKEKEIDLTIHKYVESATKETAASEFENIYVSGQKIDLVDTQGWTSWPGANKGTKFIVLDSGLNNQLIALEQGYTNLKVFDSSGNQKLDSKIIPIITKDTGGAFISTIALADTDNFLKMVDLGLLTVENRTNTYILLPTEATGQDGEVVFANIDLMEFAAANNQKLIDIIKQEMNQLPQQLEVTGYWILENDF